MKSKTRKRTDDYLNCMACNIGDVITFPTSRLPYLILDKSNTSLQLVSKRQRYWHGNIDTSFYRLHVNLSGILPSFYENAEYQVLLATGKKWLDGEIKGTMNVRLKLEDVQNVHMNK